MTFFRAASAALGVLVAVTACGGPEAAPTASTPMVAASSPSASPRVPDVPGPGDQTITIDWAGKARTAQVHAPAGYKPGMPLVVAFHYYRSDVATLREMTRLDAKADQKGFLVVYPVAAGAGFNAMGCCGDVDDVGFVKALIIHMTQTWQADRRRVFVTGISNGGDMSFRLAVEATGMIAAIAPVSGGFIGERAAEPNFRATAPVSVVTFIGSLDRATTYNEGLDKWWAKQVCKAVAHGYYDKEKTISWNRAKCADGSEVVDYQITGMGHRWPGGTNAGLGAPEVKINAVDVMWEFFAAHPLRA